MVPVRKDLVLLRQVDTTRVNQVDARQAILGGNLLGTQVFLDREREVGATLDRGVVGDDHALMPHDPADAGDNTGGRCRTIVHTIGGKLGEFEKGRADVEQSAYPLTGQQFPPALMLGAGLGWPAQTDLRDLLLEVPVELPHGVGVLAKLLGTRIDGALEDAH